MTYKPGSRVRLNRATNNTVGRPERFFTRLGTVVTGKRSNWRRETLLVRWDGCVTAERLHPRLLELVGASSDDN